MPVEENRSRLEAETILNEMRRLSAKPHMSADERKKFDELEAQHAIVSGAYDRSKRALLAKREDKIGIRRPPFDDREARANFRNYLVTGESRNMIMSGTDGSYLVPASIWPTFIVMLKGYDQIFDPSVVTWLETDTGAPMPVPMLDDTAISATKVDENNISITTANIVFDQLALGRCPTWRSGWVAVPIQLVQDSAYPLETMLNKVFAPRIARAVGADLMATVITAAAVGVTTASGQVSTVIGDDLYSLLGSVNEAYAESPTSGWMMRFATLIAIYKLKDSYGRYIFKPERDANGRPLLLERPVYLCPSVDAIGAGNKPILFGDLSRIAIHAVRDSYGVIVAKERLADYYQFAYQSFLRANYGLLRQSGSDSPIKYLQNASS
jgi:HK97 family phage major capsid protein